MTDVVVAVLAVIGAMTVVSALGLYGLALRETSIARQVDVRMARADDAHLRAEVDLQFRELVAREWPTTGGTT